MNCYFCREKLNNLIISKKTTNTKSRINETIYPPKLSATA